MSAVGGLAACYFLAAYASLLLAIAPGYASAVWAPSGIALAALLAWGIRLWPGIWIGAAAANFAVDGALPVALVIASGNALEAICTAWLVQRMIVPRLQEGFSRPESVFRFTAIAATGALVSATPAVLALFAAGIVTRDAILANGYTWWLGDLVGMVVLTPFLLAWHAPREADAPRRSVEVAAFSLSLALTLALVFDWASQQVRDSGRALAFLLFPFSVWAGARFTQRTVTTATVALAGTAIWYTARNEGLFAADTREQSLLVLQAFTGIFALLGLVLAASNRARSHADAQARAAHDRLEAMVRERTAELERKNDALAQDIIEKGQLASSLQEREAQLAEAQAITHIGSWTWDVASNRVTWSDELYRIYGLSPDTFGASFEAYLAHVHPDDRPHVMAAVQGALERQEPWEIKERIRRPDGSVRVLRSIGKIVTDAAGRTVGLHGVCLDDTERTRLEQIQAVHLDVTKALVQARAWREAVETALRILCERLGWSLGQMWRIDAQANVLRHELAASAEQLPAWSGFVEDSKAFAFAPGVGLPGAVWSQQRALWSEDVQRDPNFPRRAAAERAGLHAGFALPLMAGGQVLGVLELFHQEARRPDHDLLQMLGAVGSQLGEYLVRSESEAHLRKLEEAVRHTQQFLAMLAHELRNPLAPMRNAVSIMQALQVGEDIARCRDIIGRQIDHLSRLVDDLLDASRITRGRIEVRRESVDLASVLHRALEASRPLIDSKCHRLLVSVPEEPVMVNGDGVRLAQMLQNLLNNAAKYTPQGGVIDISLRPGNGAAVIEVRDTGVGLSDALLPKVFDLFVQGEQGLDRAEGGLGIGLTLVREIAHLHGGSVQAASAGPGQGTTFTLRLPLLQDDLSDAEAVAQPVPAHEVQASSRRRILVVDDNRDAADSLCALVKFWGHECWSAYDGASALPLADLHTPDVVLLDIGLPGMDGYEIAARLRARPALRDAIMIALTGYGQPEDRERTRGAGFSHHLLKPVDTDALRNMLGQHRSRT